MVGLVKYYVFTGCSRASGVGGTGQLVASCRATLHACLRTATLRNDFEGQAVLINCLLRNYLHYNLYNQADKLVLKSTFPEQASNNEWARYQVDIYYIYYQHNYLLSKLSKLLLPGTTTIWEGSRPSSWTRLRHKSTFSSLQGRLLRTPQQGSNNMLPRYLVLTNLNLRDPS